MPSTDPTLDLDALDLDHPTGFVSRENLDKHLKQRGTFQMADGVLHQDVEAGVIVGFKEIREQDWWAADHIPGRPMFPGALMIETAAQFASYDYSEHRLDPAGRSDRFVGFGGVDNCRFRGLVEPGCRMIFVVTLERAGSRMFRYAAQAWTLRDGQRSGRPVFEATILGVLV